MGTIDEIAFRGTSRFEVVRRIGAGGMGVVYEANDRERHARVALKTLRMLEATALLRLKTEFRALQDLAHPNLVSLGELIEEGGQWFFTMELVDGVDFLRWVRPPIEKQPDFESPTQPLSPGMRIKIDRRFDEARLRQALRQLASGLSALHGFGKVHRDIKPSNILVTRDGRVVLLDFGVVSERNTDSYLTDSQQIIGTASYMAPEQATATNVGPEADCYSVGVLLYQALTGKLPFDGSPVEVLLDKQRAEPAPPSALVRDLPADLDSLCVDLLRLNPRQRPSGSEVLRRLGVAPDRPTPAVPSEKATPFIGRGKELAELANAFTYSRAGAAVTVCVRGESGVGKSALVRRFAEQIAQQHPGTVVLAGRCNERESVPYKALDRVVDALSRYMMQLDNAEALVPRMASLLAQVFPVLWRVEAIAQAPRPQPEVRDPQELRRRAFGALRELLSRLADRHPLVLVIDDLQWADADSLALLADIVRPPESPALLLLTTLRPLPDEQLDVVTRLEGDVRTLDLERLPPDDARALAELLLARSGGAMDPSAIAQEAGGHPLFIDELIRYVLVHGSAGVHLDEALGARISALAAPARRILELVCAAGAPLAQDTVTRAAALVPVDFARLVTVLRVANLVRTTGVRGSDAIEPYHDRVRDAVLHHLDAEALRGSHQRLAMALQAEPMADPESLAIHWRGAGDLVRAAQFAAQAAAQAAGALAFDRAAQLYRMAIEVTPPDDAGLVELRAKLGEALANAGRGADAAAAYLEAAKGAGAADALEYQRRAAEQLLVSGHIDEGLAAIRRLLGAVGMKLPETPRGALASLVYRRLRVKLRGFRFRERDASQIPPQQLRRIDICWSVACGLALVDTLRGADFNARHMLLALSAGEPLRIARALAVEINFTATAGGKTRKRTDWLHEAARALIEKSKHPPALGRLLASLGGAAYLQGRFKEGLELSERAVTIFREQSGMMWEFDTSSTFVMFCLAYLGEMAELSRRVPAALREATERGDLYLATNLRLGYPNLIWLAKDDPDGASREATEAMQRWAQGSMRLQHYYELLALAHVDLYRGDAASALARVEDRWQPLARAMFLRNQVIRVNMLHLRARAALRLAQDGDASRLPGVERAAAAITRERMPWSDPLANLLRAGIAAVRKDVTAAAAELASAETGFAAADMRFHAQVAKRQRGLIVGGDEGRLLVTAADEWFTEQGVRRPASMSQLFAPGF